ncbi:MAG: response regulator, partial [Bdellovibrionales bacterium]|nr:response regulator [Bdellovibrionales bacterium]
FSLIVFGWWIGLLATVGLSSSSQVLILFALVATLGLIPTVSAPQDYAFTIIVASSVGILLYWGQAISGVSLILVGVLAYRNSVSLGMENLVSAGSLCLLRLRDDLSDPLLRSLMLEGLHLIFRVNRFGVAQEGDPSLFCHRLKRSWVASHHTPISEIAPEVLRLEGEAGIIRPTALGYEFSLRIREVFGLGAGAVAFYTIGSPSSQKRVRIFFPMGPVFDSLGRSYGFRLGLLYFLVVSHGLQHSQSREQGSTRYRETSALLDEQRADLNHIIHLVNNVTQELSAAMSGDDLRGDGKHEFADSLHALAAEVSDFRLARELDVLLQQSGNSDSSLLSFQYSLQRYANALSRRYAVPIHLDLATVKDNEVFREDEAIVLLIARTLMRVIAVQQVGGMQYELKSRYDGEIFELAFAGVNPEVSEQRMRSGAFRRLSSVERQVISALHLITSKLSFLQVDGSPQGEGGIRSFRLRLPIVRREAKAISTGKRRILFVDDNQQILNLYSRIAGALQMDYETSPSIESALTCIEEHGAPHLLVMDLQLVDGSGKELLSQLVERHLCDFPVLVISGEDAHEFKQIEKIYSQFSLKFLSKPVSQQVLVQSIQGLLSSYSKTLS